MRMNEIYIIQHLRNTYGGSLKYKDHCLILEIGSDKFRVNLTDKNRFGYYTFFHRSNARRLDGKYDYHVQLKTSNLGKGLFQCWTHELHKESNIWYTEEDWKRFVDDAHKYGIRSEIDVDFKPLCAKEV